MLKYIFLFLFGIISFQSKGQTGGLLIGGGTIVVMEGSPKIVILNGKYEFNGSFIQPADSEIILAGDAPYSESLIGGIGYNQIKNLTVNKSADGLRLQGDIYVNGSVNFLNGMMDLNGFNLNLTDDGELIGESENSRVIGANGGFITKSINLDMPNQENPGNLGAILTTNKDLGFTTIKRSHVPAENNENMGLQRVFDIEPANNEDLNAMVKFQYFDGELNGNTESDLTIYRHDGNSWEDMGLDIHDMENNTIEVFGVNHFSLWTIGSLSNALPIELLSFTAKANDREAVDLYWTTASEFQNDHFLIEKSDNSIDFLPLEKVASQGNSNEKQFYSFTDTVPFSGANYYRLKQVDHSHESSNSSIRLVNFMSMHQEILIYPNPTSNQLTVDLNLVQDSEVDIELKDVLGRDLKKFFYKSHLKEGNQKLSFNVQELAKGSYFLTIRINGNNYTKPLLIH
jgi:hypothetical protein